VTETRLHHNCVQELARIAAAPLNILSFKQFYCADIQFLIQKDFLKHTIKHG